LKIDKSLVIIFQVLKSLYKRSSESRWWRASAHQMSHWEVWIETLRCCLK